MLDDQDRVVLLHELAQGADQPVVVARVQADRGLVEDVQNAGQAGTNAGGQANPLLLTGNTDTVYCIAKLDLDVDGPTVVEIPAGSGPGTVNDAFFRFVIDMGAPGPDRGKGGKYLIVPPGYEGDLPKEGYFVAKSPSYSNLLMRWRILLQFIAIILIGIASFAFRN